MPNGEKLSSDGVLKILLVFMLGLILSGFTYLNSTKLDKEVFQIYQSNNKEDHEDIKQSLITMHEKLDELKDQKTYTLNLEDIKDKGDI